MIVRVQSLLNFSVSLSLSPPPSRASLLLSLSSLCVLQDDGRRGQVETFERHRRNRARRAATVVVPPLGNPATYIGLLRRVQRYVDQTRHMSPNQTTNTPAVESAMSVQVSNARDKISPRGGRLDRLRRFKSSVSSLLLPCDYKLRLPVGARLSPRPFCSAQRGGLGKGASMSGRRE